MANIIEIIKINPVEQCATKKTGAPYELHTAECALLDERDGTRMTGRLRLPYELRKQLGGVPNIGTYRAEIGFACVDGELLPRIFDLQPCM